MDSMTRYTLTAQDVRALRHADAICFDHRGGNGVGQLRAIVRADRSSTGFEQTHVIPCESRLDDYSGEPAPNGHNGFHMAMYAQHDRAARTLVHRLRAGNEIVLRWVRGNSSPVSKEIGFVRDELYLTTGKPDTRSSETYLVAVYTGYDNTARMVRSA